MAFLAELGALTDDLLAAVSGSSSNVWPRREAAFRTLRNNNFPRTNQFEVAERLSGLEERFSVVGRDGLAEALRTRLAALEPHRNQYTPEVLHLLLELADQPALNSKLSDLDALIAPEEDAPPPLTWRDVAREDGWKQERDIWRFVDYSPGSSDEDEVDGRSDASADSLTTASSVGDRSQRIVLDMATESHEGEALLNKIKDAQAWRHASAVGGDGRPKKISITTLQLLREALFMLAGLETSLFDSKCNLVTKYQLPGISWDSYKALTTAFSECGRKLAPLRAFVKTKEQVPLLQVFQDCIQRALLSLDTELSAIQNRLVGVQKDVVISLIGVLSELNPTLAPLYALADIVRQIREERNPHAFRYLELLYDAVGIAQVQGNRPTYRLLGTIFFDCFRVYLKPIRLWIEEGKILPGDRTFFVSESPTKLPLPRIWRGQFKLLRTPEGNLHAPRFLNPSIQRIFTAGKSIVVLKHMKQHASTQQYRDTIEPPMDFATVCSDELELAPFSELFAAAFQGWFESKHHTAAATLRELLFSSYGLSQSLTDLQHLYLMSDGARSSRFATSIFRHLDSFSSSWRDRFTLTELAQEAFAPCVDSHRLSADIDPRSTTHGAMASRSSVRYSLPAIRLHYRLSWPVQIVIPEEAIQGYQALFTFQFQARRALSLLQRPLQLASRHRQRQGMERYYLLRAKLLWFTNTITTYLTTLVLAPNIAKLRTKLYSTTDTTTDTPTNTNTTPPKITLSVDDMIGAHATFVGRVADESCLTPKLKPIRDGVLDIFDLAIRLEDAQRAENAKVDDDEMEVSRLSFYGRASMSSVATRGSGMRRAKRRRLGVDGGGEDESYNDGDDDDDDGEDEEEEEGSGLGEWMMRKGKAGGDGKPYATVLREIEGDFERHLRFVASGLRSVARASKEEAAGKWDLLAEMLEVGIQEQQ
ncbi:Spc98 family-domain-containing protein [Dichotomopilus funicola]|uniref:Spindle pole body component n=1 Tax=Dichotomopilus funicola TaxID=1934379 RepID=A0AAN6ZPS3_9PEZI|nr:Spc98 family-domain-containing protein [Dichotomopilus funicola]